MKSLGLFTVNTQVTQALNVYDPFFHFYANVQPYVTYGIYYYITTKFDYVKRDSGLAAYGGVVLQPFEFIKVCVRMQWLCLKSQLQLFLYFVNKICLPCYCVVSFVVCQLPRPI